MKNWVLHKLIQLSGKKIIFPFYHIVSDEDCSHVKHLYPIKRIAKFEEELDFLQRHFAPLTLEELMSHVESGTEPEKPSFFLSFDDGLRECYTVIAPILKRRNIPAAFFINTGFAGNKALFYRYKVSLIIDRLKRYPEDRDAEISQLLRLTYHDTAKIDELAKKLDLDFEEFLEKNKPYMNWEEIEELKNQGFYFGGHSVDHPYYYQIPFEEQIRQTKESVDEVIEKLNLDYRIFSFPFTDEGVRKDFFNQIFTQNICDLSFGTSGIKKDEISQNLQRLSMDKSLGNSEEYIRKNLFLSVIKRILNKDVRRH